MTRHRVVSHAAHIDARGVSHRSYQERIELTAEEEAELLADEVRCAEELAQERVEVEILTAQRTAARVKLQAVAELSDDEMDLLLFRGF